MIITQPVVYRFGELSVPAFAYKAIEQRFTALHESLGGHKADAGGRMPALRQVDWVDSAQRPKSRNPKTGAHSKYAAYSCKVSDP